MLAGLLLSVHKLWQSWKIVNSYFLLEGHGDGLINCVEHVFFPPLLLTLFPLANYLLLFSCHTPDDPDYNRSHSQSQTGSRTLIQTRNMPDCRKHSKIIPTRWQKWQLSEGMNERTRLHWHTAAAENSQSHNGRLYSISSRDIEMDFCRRAMWTYSTISPHPIQNR